MREFTEHPAHIMAVDRERGDTFIATTLDTSYVVKAEETLLRNSDTVLDRPVPGYIGLAMDGTPCFLRVHDCAFVVCSPLYWPAACDACFWGHLSIEGHGFKCNRCKATL